VVNFIITVIAVKNHRNQDFIVKFGICNEIFKGWEWARVAGYVSSLGYSGIELAPFVFAGSVEQVSAGERKEIADIAGANGLEITGLHWLLASPKGLSLSSPDRSIRERSTEYLKALARFCGDVGGKVMVFGSPKARDIPPSSGFGETYERVKDCFFSILPVLKERGVILALEPLTQKETNFINSAKEAIRMIEEIGHPNFKLNLDVKAMSAENRPIPEVLGGSGRHLVHVHVNDPSLLGPGSGEVDYAPIREALQKIGYEGYLSVEVFDFSPGPESIASTSIEYLKKIFDTDIR